MSLLSVSESRSGDQKRTQTTDQPKRTIVANRWCGLQTSEHYLGTAKVLGVHPMQSDKEAIPWVSFGQTVRAAQWLKQGPGPD